MLDRLSVKNDFIFQKIFGCNENKAILIDFLNALLGLPAGQQITDLEISENTRLQKEYPEDKLGILDIKAQTDTGELINIEIQLLNQYDMDQRTLFYWARLYTGQLKEGQLYRDLKKAITINILDFNFIEVDYYHTVFHLFEDRHRDYQLTDMLEVHFVELPKFRKATADPQNPLEGWLFYIEDSPKEVLDMAIQANPNIAKAEELLQRLGSLEEVRRYYEAREKAIRDENNRLVGAREEGRAEGEAIGEARGVARGESKGIKKTALNMLAKGLSEDLIREITGLSADEIVKLKSVN
jgi:predicted transposase/invertase (TIGR01784 family)